MPPGKQVFAVKHCGEEGSGQAISFPFGAQGYFFASVTQCLSVASHSERVYSLLLVRVKEQPAQITWVMLHLFPQCSSLAYLTAGMSLALIPPLLSPGKFGCSSLFLVKIIYFLNAELLI